MTVTILGVKGLPLHLGSTRNDNIVDEEGWSTSYPKAENTKQTWKDNGGQE